MLYELRIYSIPPGRMADIQARTLGAVPPLFAEHGMKAVGYWTVVAGRRLPAFAYILEWRDAAHQEASWRAFGADERWRRLRAESNARSELVEDYALSLLRPNPDWPGGFQAAPDPAPEEVHDLVSHEAALGHNQAVTDHLLREVLPIFQAAGGRVLAVFDAVAGPVMPAVSYILAWPDYARRAAGWSAFNTAAVLRARAEDHPARFRRRLLGGGDVYLMAPVAWPARSAP